MKTCMREPGIEPGPTPWQGAILPLDHSRLDVLFACKGGVAQMVERSLSMREVQGSIPCISTLLATLLVQRLSGLVA